MEKSLTENQLNNKNSFNIFANDNIQNNNKNVCCGFDSLFNTKTLREMKLNDEKIKLIINNVSDEYSTIPGLRIKHSFTEYIDEVINDKKLIDYYLNYKKK